MKLDKMTKKQLIEVVERKTRQLDDARLEIDSLQNQKTELSKIIDTLKQTDKVNKETIVSLRDDITKLRNAITYLQKDNNNNKLKVLLTLGVSVALVAIIIAFV